MLEDRVLEVLQKAKGFVTAAEIQFGVSLDEDVSARNVRRAVTELQRRGYPVVAGDSGYILAETLQELHDYRERLAKGFEGLVEKIRILNRLIRRAQQQEQVRALETAQRQ